MYNKIFTIKFRVPRGSPEGTKPRDPEVVLVNMPSQEEYPQGFLIGLAENVIEAFIREKINNNEVIHENVFAQYQAETATRGVAIPEEVWVSATESFKNFSLAALKKPETAATLASAFRAGFRTRYSPEMATKIQIGLQKWYTSLSQPEQELYETLADKLNTKLESYKLEDLSSLDFG